MASDYDKIRSENIKRYGTEIGRIGKILLANRYDERTHFIFELLQNAEDAYRRLEKIKDSYTVSFELQKNALRVNHHGDPFVERDVRGICGIDESNKKINEIGRFGIGFKSVYAFTDRPEIHSGKEHFAIEEFVRPIEISKKHRNPNETVIYIPFREPKSAYTEINKAFVDFNPSSLLFLHYINEITWQTEPAIYGRYLRQSRDIDSNVREIITIREQSGEDTTCEEWLVFHQQVTPTDDNRTQCIEIAFLCEKDPTSGDQRIVPVKRSPLVAFFPTMLETHLGFLIQGPYRTTPSRDNIPRDNEWNRQLVEQTADLLQTSLCWLRDRSWLNTSVLECLPLDPEKFDNTTMFVPFFTQTKLALSDKPLLPCNNGGFIPASNALLGRTQELRNLFDSAQLTSLRDEKIKFSWLTDDITQNRTPKLYKYLTKELEVPEITPEIIIRQLNYKFLMTQSDIWIEQLYEFLNEQPRLRFHRLFSDIPLIRLNDGKHETPENCEHDSIFLPIDTTTGFSTVRASVCTSRASREFLKSLGLNEPDLVDDVITNICSKYHEQMNTITLSEYESDISRILTAFSTDSQTQKRKLIETLSKTRFVKSINITNNSKTFEMPKQIYFGTQDFKNLLNGTTGIYFVDESYNCLQGEAIRNVLEKSGVTNYLKPIKISTSFSDEKKRSMRINAGCEDCSGEESIVDVTLKGFDPLLKLLPGFEPEEQIKRAKLLWEALVELNDKRGEAVFFGTYTWRYVSERRSRFSAKFVRQLNETQWVPDGGGKLRQPRFVLFDSLGWTNHPFLESIISFKSPVIDVIAQNFGIEPGMIKLLKDIGICTENELREKLKLGNNSLTEKNNPSEQNQTNDSGEKHHPDNNDTDIGADSDSTNNRFKSYIAIHPESEEIDSDGLTNENRMILEEQAIKFILESEPDWERTPPNNPGYDLFRTNQKGEKVYCEVKAMTKDLDNHPVGISHTQFDCARRHGDLFWLYIVEYAGSKTDARIIRIQNPAGRASTFTYDKGWRTVDTPLRMGGGDG